LWGKGAGGISCGRSRCFIEAEAEDEDADELLVEPSIPEHVGQVVENKNLENRADIEGREHEVVIGYAIVVFLHVERYIHHTIISVAGRDQVFEEGRGAELTMNIV
jgi:hypothetical protein